MGEEMTPLKELTKEINDRLKAAATIITKCYSLCESCKGPVHDGPLVQNYIDEMNKAEGANDEPKMAEDSADTEAEYNAGLQADRDREMEELEQ